MWILKDVTAYYSTHHCCLWIGLCTFWSLNCIKNNSAGHLNL